MSGRFVDEMAEVFEISSGELSEAEVFLDKAPWDSLRVLSVISLVDEYYSVALSTTDILKCRNIDEIYDTVRSKGGSL
jgi:acyl carrier protein